MTAAAAAPPVPFLDHLVLLLPHATLQKLPSWLESNLNILPGGRHADGLTENKLVIFADGVYLELIAFVPGISPEARRSHKWGREKEGHFIDWAFSVAGEPSSSPSSSSAGASASGDGGTPEENYEAIRQRVNGGADGIEYIKPIAGGRIKGDGTHVKWAVSFSNSTDPASDPVEPGFLPFWCLDRTPRELRVPFHTSANVVQPSKALGVAEVAVTVPHSRLQDVYGLIQNTPGEEVPGSDKQERRWDLAVLEDGARSQRTFRVQVDPKAGTSKVAQKIQVALLTEVGTEQKVIGGEIVEGLEVWIELRPKSAAAGGSS